MVGLLGCFCTTMMIMNHHDVCIVRMSQYVLWAAGVCKHVCLSYVCGEGVVDTGLRKIKHTQQICGNGCSNENLYMFDLEKCCIATS